MPYSKFVAFNVFGGIGWVVLMTSGGLLPRRLPDHPEALREGGHSASSSSRLCRLFLSSEEPPPQAVTAADSRESRERDGVALQFDLIAFGDARHPGSGSPASAGQDPIPFARPVRKPGRMFRADNIA